MGSEHMGDARKRFRAGSAGIGCALASFLIFAQAGAAHAPMASGASPALILAFASAAVPAAKARSSDEKRFSALPFKKLKFKQPAAAPRLTPMLGKGSYAALQIGPLRYPDGAAKLPGRSNPALEPPQETDANEVGHSVSVPTAIRMAENFDVYASEKENVQPGASGQASAGFPFVSAAHAAPSAGFGMEAMGGPMSRMPIEGHILFEERNADLTGAAQRQLEKMLKALRGTYASLDVVAYAGRKGTTSSEARRLSLRRGLAVRAYLVSRGIDQKRISVRPMGGVRDDGPKARVDVFYASY